MAQFKSWTEEAERIAAETHHSESDIKSLGSEKVQEISADANRAFWRGAIGAGVVLVAADLVKIAFLGYRHEGLVIPSAAAAFGDTRARRVMARDVDEALKSVPSLMPIFAPT